jgi:hypothetical protein
MNFLLKKSYWFGTPDLPQRKWYVQEILDAQVKAISFTQSEVNFLKAKRDIL